MELLQPLSVLDIGCGRCGWLAEFQKAGCEVCGVDGDYVDRDKLFIPSQYFYPSDIEECTRMGSVPRIGDRHFSLVLSVEVAEHLSPECADSFVKLLTRYSDVVVFSAAIPHQGGTHHVNEQWPDYWIAKFEGCTYRLHDVLRSRIWDDRLIQPWYRQNLLLFIKSGEEAKFRGTRIGRCALPVRLVNPDFYLLAVNYFNSYDHIKRQPTDLLVRSLTERWRHQLSAAVKKPLQRILKLMAKGS